MKNMKTLSGIPEKQLKIFGKRLKNARKKAGIKTQELFADMVGVHLKTVRNWEQGIYAPDLANLVFVCDLLDCSMDYILGFADDVSRIEPFEKDTLESIADQYGYDSQTTKAIEELSELIHAIARHKMRFSGSRESKLADCEEKDAVAEEIADVIITLYQVEYLLGIDSERISEIAKVKIKRQMERMKKE